MEKILCEVRSILKTIICFLLACFSLPLLLLSFVCVHYSNKFVNYILSIKYPTLTISKSKNIRALIDTPRNAGIFHFLLEVKGQCDFEKIKKYYADNLIELRDKAGFLRFPKLRQKLVTRWGHYAWVNDHSSFNINNHVLLNTCSYRGRAVNDNNIQQFVSHLVTKYISSDLPQWQVIVIPITSNGSTPFPENTMETPLKQRYYILIKLHHLIIGEEEDLRISEFLMLHDNEGKKIVDEYQLCNISKMQTNCISNFVCEPVHIKRLVNYYRKLIRNYWTAFIYKYESLETPDGYRNVHITNFTQLLSVLLIVLVNVCIDYRRMMAIRNKLQKQNYVHKQDFCRISIMKRSLKKEIGQRNLSWKVAYEAIFSSFQPANIVKTLSKFLWKTNLNMFLLMPYYIYCEILVLRNILFKRQASNRSTVFSGLYFYLPLLICAQIELYKICYEIFKAPVNIIEELFLNTSKESNILQKKSYSGRKIISFSKSIDTNKLKERISFNNQIRESDFILMCLAGALFNYFNNDPLSAPVPNVLNTTCRTIAKEYLTSTLGCKTDHFGGAVFLKLPLRAPNYEHAMEIHSIVENMRRKQIMIYLASMGQIRFNLLTALIPRVLSKVCINFFSHNFPVAITEIYGSTRNFQTVWGHKVEDVLLFQPPQSKTCLSLNLHHFGTKCRLAVMADTQLGPNHSQIPRWFENYIENVTF